MFLTDLLEALTNPLGSQITIGSSDDVDTYDFSCDD